MAVRFILDEKQPKQEQGKRSIFNPAKTGLQPKDFPVGQAFSGGAARDFLDILGAAGFGTVGAVERALEQLGTLERKGVTGQTTRQAIGRGVQRRRSFLDILDRLGKERKPTSFLGKLATRTLEPTTSVLRNLPRELPGTALGFGLDVAVDPLQAIPLVGAGARALTAGSKLLQRGGRQLGRVGRALKKLPIIREFTVGGGLPEEFIKQRNRLRIDNAIGGEEAIELTKSIAKLPIEEQRLITDFITGGVRNKQVIDGKTVKTTVDLTAPQYTNSLKELADPIRQEVAMLGRDMVERGLINEQTYVDNLGEYLGRAFRKFEAPDAEAVTKVKVEPPRIRFKEFAKRKSLNDEALEAMGEIREAGFASAKTIEKLKRAINTDEFFKQVDNTFGVSNKIAKQNPGAYIKLEGKGFGVLDGKFVPKIIANDLNNTFQPSAISRDYSKWMGRWKKAKIVYNPSTWSRNQMWNLMINDMSPAGLSITNPLQIPNTARIYREAATDVLRNSDYFKEVKKVTGIGIDSSITTEMRGLLGDIVAQENPNLFLRGWTQLQKWDVSLGKGYGNLDTISKLAHMKGMQAQGATLEEAAKSANLFLVDYANVPKIVERVRSPKTGIDFAFAFIGNPFLSFTLGVIKPLSKLTVTDPAQLAKITKGIGAVERITLDPEEANMSPEELTVKRTKARQAEPDWINNGLYMKMPYKDDRGRDQVLNLQYILPFNALENIRTDNPLSQFSTSGFTGSPFLQIASGLAQNKDTFGRDIIPPGSTKGEATIAVQDWMFKFIAPNLAPSPFFGQEVAGEPKFGGFGLDRIINAIQDRPDAQSVPAALIDVLAGLRIQPIKQGDFPQIRLKGQISELQREITRTRFRTDITPQERNERIQNLQKQIQKTVQATQKEVSGR